VTSRPIRLVQLTDLHLHGAPDGRLRGVATLAAFEAALATARARLAPWSALLLTGDLVNDDPDGYRHLARVLGGSAEPAYCIPGNHDEPTAMRAALAGAPFRVGGHARVGDWLLVMLDSRVSGATGGRLARAELDRLDATLAAHADRHALVCVHHQPVPVGSRWLDAIGIDNADELFAVLDRHPRVRAVVWGHVHQAYDGERRGVRLLGTPATCVQFRPCSAEFALDDLPPGMRWLDLHPDGRIDSGICWVDPATLAPGA
jgi:Icc protein